MNIKNAALGACVAFACLPASAGAATATSSADPIKEICSSDTIAARALGTNDRILRTGGSAERETLYLPDAAYVVKRCTASGELERATLYRRQTSPYTKAFYQPETYVERKDDDEIGVMHIDYGNPTATGGEALWKKAAATADAEQPSDKALLSAATRSSRTRERSTPRRSTSRQSAAGKCASNTYAFLSPTVAWLPSHGFGYYVNLPSTAWDAAVDGGRVVVDDRWNYCGFQVAPRTSSYRIGYWQGGGWNSDDDVNMVTSSTAAASICGPNAVACAYTTGLGYYQAPWGPYYRARNFDMIFNTSYCLVDGAAAGCYDIRGIAAHEFMHVYGVAHNWDPNSIMYGENSNGAYERTEYRYLSMGDLNAIGHLYG